MLAPFLKFAEFYESITSSPSKQKRFEESLGLMKIVPRKFLTLKEWILNNYYLIFKFSFHLLVNMRKLRSNYQKNPSFD